MSERNNPQRPAGTGQIGQIRSLNPQRPAAPPPPPAPGEVDEPDWTPPPLTSLEDTGLNLLAVADLVLKVLYFGGYMTGHAICDVIKLPFPGVVDKVITFLKREKYIEVQSGSSGFGEAGYQYMVSEKGSAKARDAMERTQYAGPAPVPVGQYVEAMRAQNKRKISVRQTDLRKVTENLVIADEMLNKIGPAVNGGRSIFLYGPPGNGKTTIAERVGRIILGVDLWIPYAFDVDGQIVQVFDAINHEVSENQTVRLGTGLVADPRWVKIKRPMIMVGGELTLDGLDLVYDPINKFYEAPFQVKANGGMFLIDDFGRQPVRPQDLLNRWIVPLEKSVDFLTLNNGRKIEMPFFVMIVFSTNLAPKDLVDDAFLRRIRYKIEVGNPTPDQFREIFKIICKLKKVPYTDEGLAYLLKEWYFNKEKPDRFRDLRMVHPRDLISQLLDIAAYLDVPPTLSKDLIDRAAASYFVKLS